MYKSQGRINQSLRSSLIIQQWCFCGKKLLWINAKKLKVLAIWRWRNLSLAGKITIFKSLAFSKIIFISYLSYVPKTIINKLEKLQIEFIWNNKNSKIKHSTLIADYADGGLKDIDIKAKLNSLHLSWIRRLYDPNFHPWKNIPLKLIKLKFDQNIFYPNMNLPPPKEFPRFYKNIQKSWADTSQNPITTSNILYQPIWFNSFIIVSNLPIKKLFKFELFIYKMYEEGTLIAWGYF